MSSPSNASILVDLDNTIYDMTVSWEQSVQQKYPGIKCDYHPITERLLAISVLKGCASISRIYENGFYLDEAGFPSVIGTLRNIQQEQDIWFVTMTIGTYHAPLSEFEKNVQLLRDFGTAGEKTIFTGKKYQIPGKFLIDDHPLLRDDEKKSTWQGITVKQVYNIESQCEKWIETTDFGRIMQYL